MKKLMIEDYNDFSCIGEKCPICCCAGGWNIFVDDESVRSYRNIEGEFGDELRNNLISENGKTRFNLNPKGECSFLNKEGLCRIYLTLGADSICVTCKTYPRKNMNVGDIEFYSLSTSCPEVTRRIMNRIEPVQIELCETPNNKLEDIKLRKMNWLRFNSAIRVFTGGMDILQNRKYKIQDRICLLMRIIGEFEKTLKSHKSTKEIEEQYKDSDIEESWINDVRSHGMGLKLMISSFSLVFGHVLGNNFDLPLAKKCREMFEHIKENGGVDQNSFTKALKGLNNNDIQIELEQVFSYRFFMAFMSGYNKTEFYMKMIYECILYSSLTSYIALFKSLLGYDTTREDRVLFYSLCSRIDHSESQMNQLYQWIQDENLHEDRDKLISLLRIPEDI